ncbi:uncharacterized protein LOC123919543 isoform X2 [Trifolium pratense]|uniref:uncharacterized protein LOC123919543 isoform X2 n=1 Tax=Trifolium pratense TaxID=57577 RepID=UPI001E696C31|nr:uncharacterized protein LOC123919543 isoform X2 [Trifolium pratense]XP_045827436.1 uncharacterized protein LOC123919543 isoform X2 [Trifolium pratense]XP_045827437.1 uncharacterized protein LOC123919543 isoform X2 [Trifolium pratense]XP_045827438.1 uncharacterized protein LOC123919543 isoform X2 [Trifolium pratense]XP_045827439.1 uncharacterized protein LOC123919543 isoform X2 [Trifolium pratense]XP_045827440.1 uncharacterized protein LOC123919543 isoform X2 [Trifolium pratense]
MGDASNPSQSGLNTQSTKKNVRGCTRMKKLELLSARGERKSIDFNSDGRPIGKTAHDFKYHVASLAREKISILINEWDKVGSEDRNEIWTGLKQVWDIPKNAAAEKKTMIYAGERWKAFKNSLTSRYIDEKGNKFGKSAADDYSYIGKETWNDFVKSREDPAFLEKRKKGQVAQSYNKYPHRLSQGGYALLEKDMMVDKLKKRKEAAGGAEVPPPSPPQRHEKWKQARLKPSGEYTSEATRLIAENISSLAIAHY